MGYATAPNTCKAYAAAWKSFVNWCRDWRRCDSLTASSDLVREFVTWANSIRQPAYSVGSIHIAIVGHVYRNGFQPERLGRLFRAWLRRGPRGFSAF